MKKTIKVNEQEFEVEVKEEHDHFKISVNDEIHIVDIADLRMNGFSSILVDDQSFQVNCTEKKEGDYLLNIGHNSYEVLSREAMVEAALEEDEAVIKASMSGLVVELNVAKNDKVEEGQPLLVLEAMKMQNEITAPMAGIVTQLMAKEGETVELNQEVAVIEKEEEETDES